MRVNWGGNRPAGPPDYLGICLALYEAGTISADEVAGCVAEYIRADTVAEDMGRLPEAILTRFRALCSDAANAAQLQEWYPDKFGEMEAWLQRPAG